MTASTILARLIAGMDVLVVAGRAYMLAPVTHDLIDALAAFGSDMEDMEPHAIEDDDPAEDGEAARWAA